MADAPDTRPRMIFVNLPVTDLQRSIAFYEATGFTQNPQFSDERTMCMVLSDTIFVMLLTRSRFAEFTSREISDATCSAQVLLAITAGGRDHVDQVVQAGVDGGGQADPNPKQDMGFMYGRSIADPDGHIWEVFWMDPAAAAGVPEAA